MTGHNFNTRWSALDFAKFVAPSVLSMLSIAMYGAVDAIFIARFAGSTALAAVSIIMPLFSIFLGIGVMMAAGSSAIIGIELGKGRKRLANRHFSLGLCFLLLVLAAFLTAAFLLGLERLPRMLGASDVLMPYCMDYLKFFIFGIAAVILPTFFEFFMRLDGKPRWALYSALTGGTINAVLDYVFIVRLGMGVGGAGLACTIGLAAATLLGVFYFTFKAGTLAFSPPCLDFRFLRDALFNGSSEMVGELSAGVKTLAFNLVLIRYAGETGVAAMSILMYMLFLLSSLHVGLSMGISPVISFNFGGGDFAKIREMLRHAVFAVFCTAAFSFAVAVFFGADIIRLFTGNQGAVASLTESGMRIFAFAFLINGVNYLASGFFTAVGNGTISALIAFMNTFAFTLIFIFMLPELFGLNGVWLSVPLAELSTAALSLYFINRYKRIYIMPEPAASLATPSIAARRASAAKP